MDEKKETVLKGRYRLLATLGRGAMGTVFLAHDAVMDRRVAIKVLRLPEGLSAGAQDEALRRFYREARLAGRLIHPNIIATFDIDHDGGYHFISMELAEGRTLATLLEEGDPIAAAPAAGIALQVCRALEFAHSHGVVHRDIKPGNIFVIGGDRVKVGDFGIARSMDSATLTQTGYSMGTPQYMSPEQVRGEPLDPRSDIFSLGVVLYEMLEGANPFAADTPPTVIYNILEKEPPSLEGRVYDMPGLSQVLARALHKDAAARYQDAGEMALDLETLLGGAAPDAAALQPTGTPSSQPGITAAAGKEEPAKKGGRRKWLIVSIAAVLAVCITLAVVLPLLLLGGDEEGARPDPAEAIMAFVAALRRGDVGEAAAFLTRRARQELDLDLMIRRMQDPDEQPQEAELEFDVVEEGEQIIVIKVWAVGEVGRVSLGMWTLYWDGERWLIEKPGVFAQLNGETEGGSYTGWPEEHPPARVTCI
ncbi:MAG: serine/threonine protein kinase [Actinobacteria bacterium]|nr:serine/threonine protein kinase [Actinomycetota bacterium]